VVLESKYGSPKIVNDGVTIAKEVELADPVENIGAKLVRQVREGQQQAARQLPQEQKWQDYMHAGAGWGTYIQVVGTGWITQKDRGQGGGCRVELAGACCAEGGRQAGKCMGIAVESHSFASIHEILGCG
jgi:hypothetical protein